MPEHIATSSLAERDQLIERHRSYVRALAVKALRTLPVRVDLDELIAYGDIGLIEAAERYDARRGVAFSTFAHYRIKGAIHDGLREMGIFSRSGQQRTRFAGNADDIVQAATDDESAAHAEGSATDFVADEIDAAQSLINNLIPVYLLSLDSDTMPEIIDQHALSMEQIEERELIGLVLKLVKELSDDEQQLLDAVYFKHRSMTSVAAELGISKSWLSRLHTRAIHHLREQMQERGILTAND